MKENNESLNYDKTLEFFEFILKLLPHTFLEISIALIIVDATVELRCLTAQ